MSKRWSINSKLIIIALLSIQTVFAQSYISKNYSTIDGLPNNGVYSIFKDSRGILWVGTENGLSAFQNGIFRNYKIEDGLANNRCWAIVEDQSKNLWIGTYGGGISFYDGEKFQTIDVSNGLADNRIRKLQVYKNYLLVGTDDGVSVIDIELRKVLFSKKEESINKKFQVMGFFEINNEVFFGSYDSRFWKLNIHSKSIEFLNDHYINILSTFQTDSNLIFSQDNIFVSKTISRISKKDFFLNTYSERSFGRTLMWDFAMDKRGAVYSAGNGITSANGGLYKILNNKYTLISESAGVKSFELWCLDYDKIADKLYVGSWDKGFYEVNLSNQIIYHAPKEFDKEEMEIVGVEKLNNNWFIAYKKGLFICSNDTLEIKPDVFFNYIHHQNPKGNFPNMFLPALDKEDIQSFEIKGIYNKNNHLWVNTTIGLFQLNEKGIILNYFSVITASFALESPTKIFVQRAYGSVMSLDFTNPSKKFFKAYPFSEKNNPKDVANIIQLKGTYYFVSNENGLFTYKNNHFFSLFENGIWEEKKLVQSTTNNKGELIIANASGDIFFIDVNQGFSIKKIIKKEQLFGNSVTLLESYKDLIIIGTEKGLNIYKNGRLILIDEDQGLKHKIIISSKIIQDKLYVGTAEGYYEIDLNSINSNFKKLSIDVFIGSIEVNYAKLKQDNYKWNIFQGDVLNLPYDQNNISIELVPQGTDYPKKLLFRYRIKELGKKIWSNWSNSNNINLTYLPIGSNTLEIQVRDLNTGFTFSKKLLTIKIIPPFWKTYWFIISLVLIVLFSIYVSYRRRISTINKREKAKNEVQKRLVETKMEALQSQMNPHFIFNSLNSIQNFIISNNAHEALKYMGNFSKLIRQTLDNSSKAKITLEEEIIYLKRYIELENLRREYKVAIEYIIDDEIDLFEVEIPPMILQPFIENVFVHAFDTTIAKPELTISFLLQNECVRCQIQDNGIGMDLNVLQKSTSKGIKLAKERIELTQNLGFSPLEITSTIGSGTTITLSIEIR